MRCYHLGNFYLSSIQQGIQAAHVQHDMAIKYLTADSPTESHACSAEDGYVEWATNHKTMILLNGGMASHLLDFEAFLKSESHGYAWASFREEVDALNSTITSVGIVLPEKMYNGNREIARMISQEKFGVPFKIGATEAKVNRQRDPGPDGAVYTVTLFNGTGSAGVPEMSMYRYTPFEAELLARISRCDMAR